MKRLITLVIVAGTFCSCNKSSHENSTIRSVALTEPVLLESTHVINYPGIIHEAHTISLSFKTAGQIERIHVHEGDYVRQGTLLAELDNTDYKLGVEALQIQYDQLKDEVKRTKQLFDQRSISANDYEKAVVGLRQLGIQLQVNKNKLSYTKLYAPTDGYIQHVNFSPAEMVDAGTALFTLLDVSHMEVVADIPADKYKQRTLFTRFYCKAAGCKEKLPIKLLGCTPKADGNQLYQLRLAFAERPNDCMTAGLNVTVEIVATDTASTHSVSVPLCAVFRDTDTSEPCVWVCQQDSTVTKRPVVLNGMDAKGHAVITKGLTGKERIVRAGVSVLKEGERVHVIGKTSKSNIGELL